MPFFDQHLHSHHSFDSKTEPAANVRAAAQRGLAGLTFTEHYDTHPDDWPSCVYEHDTYCSAIRSLRAEFGTDLFIGQGIEVCYQPDRMDGIVDFLASRSFDLVILSVHYFQGRALYKREQWEGVDVAEGTGRYLETVLEAVRCCERLHRAHGRVFDVLGHLDLVKRYTHRFRGSFDLSPHAQLIDEILQVCLEADLVPEINTSTMRQGLDEAMPGSDTVARYAAFGGTAMSLGSDAHRAKDVGEGLDEAAQVLRDAGITRAAVFRDRQRQDVAFD